MSPYNTEGQLSLTLCVAIGFEQAFAGAAGTILPVPTLSPFAAIEKCVMKEKPQNPSIWIAALEPSGLLICSSAFAPLPRAPLGEAPMKIGQLFESIRSADLFVVFFAQPGKPLFKQRQHLLNKRLRLVVFDCHAVLLMGLKDRKLGQLNVL
jgi:hypothetical protein